MRGGGTGGGKGGTGADERSWIARSRAVVGPAIRITDYIVLSTDLRGGKPRTEHCTRRQYPVTSSGRGQADARMRFSALPEACLEEKEWLNEQRWQDWHRRAHRGSPLHSLA